MLTKRVSHIGQTLEWITGTMRVLALRPCQGLITATSESFEEV